MKNSSRSNKKEEQQEKRILKRNHEESVGDAPREAKEQDEGGMDNEIATEQL